MRNSTDRAHALMLREIDADIDWELWRFGATIEQTHTATDVTSVADENLPTWISCSWETTFDVIQKIRLLEKYDLRGQDRHLYGFANHAQGGVLHMEFGLQPRWERLFWIPFTDIDRREGVEGEIQLDESMWHTGAIDRRGSSVELAAFMGRSVARLVVEQLKVE